ncbi:MAG TPA: hypothetical protein VET84_06285 [Stellaceae bacterium]|nr:hypothetical protein [Stellaceae bacterium]
MTEEIDIWRAAHLLVKRRGADTVIVAAQRPDEQSASGDIDGQLIWKRIVAVVRELQRAEPKRLEPTRRRAADRLGRRR